MTSLRRAAQPLGLQVPGNSWYAEPDAVCETQGAWAAAAVPVWPVLEQGKLSAGELTSRCTSVQDAAPLYAARANAARRAWPQRSRGMRSLPWQQHVAARVRTSCRLPCVMSWHACRCLPARVTWLSFGGACRTRPLSTPAALWGSHCQEHPEAEAQLAAFGAEPSAAEAEALTDLLQACVRMHVCRPSPHSTYNLGAREALGVMRQTQGCGHATGAGEGLDK